MENSSAMHGPENLGHWSNATGPNCGPAHQHLVAGSRYRVAHEFRDFDGQLHPVGEHWQFLGFSFLPYDDGLSLFVSFDGTREWHIPMQWRPETQGKILDHLAQHVVKES
jgi:Domain of unknown function (DUF3601)